MSSPSSFKLIRITIGNAKGCPDGEREKYQLQHGFYTTSNKIPRTIWEDEPTHAVVYYSKKFPDKWCAGVFKGIYKVGNKIDITTEEEYKNLYPEGWWGHSPHADTYRSAEWQQLRLQRGFELTQLTDARITGLSDCKNIRGDMATLRQDNEREVVKRMIDSVERGEYDM